MALQNLPTELKFRIFQFLSLQDLIRISLVCKEFKILAETDSFWKTFYFQFQNLIVDSSVVGTKMYFLSLNSSLFVMMTKKTNHSDKI
jgi:hypothetical protein